MHWLDALIAAGIVYTLLRLEMYYQVWRWKRQKNPNPAPASTAGLMHTIVNAAETAICDTCKRAVKNYHGYGDGSIRCISCTGDSF